MSLTRTLYLALAATLLFAITIRLTPLAASRAYYTRLDTSPGYALLPNFSYEDVNSTINIDPNGHRVVDQHGAPPSAPLVHVIGGKRVFGIDFDEETIAARLATHLAPAFRVENGCGGDPKAQFAHSHQRPQWIVLADIQ